MYMKKGDKVVTLIDKSFYPKGTKGIVDQFEADCVWVAVYLPGEENPDDIIRYKYADIESCDW